jgi:hypothetical protein
MNIIDPAQFTAEALGLKPSGEPHPEPFVCAMSGFRHPAGTPALPAKFGSSFMDSAFLAKERAAPSREPLLISGYVAALMPKPIMAKIYNTCVTAKGVFKISTFNYRKHLLLNLPKPPFIIACGATMNTQHVLWKAPVSYAQEPFFVQIGNRHWPVRLSRVLDLQKRFPDPKAKPLLHTDGFLSEPNCGAPNTHNVPEDLRHLTTNLTPGDWWAYAALFSSPEPETPPKVTL